MRRSSKQILFHLKNSLIVFLYRIFRGFPCICCLIGSKIRSVITGKETHLSEPKVVKPYLKEGVDVTGVAKVPQSRGYPLKPDQFIGFLPITVLLLLSVQPSPLSEANQAAGVASAVPPAVVDSSKMAGLVHAISTPHLHR